MHHPDRQLLNGAVNSHKEAAVRFLKPLSAASTALGRRVVFMFCLVGHIPAVCSRAELLMHWKRSSLQHCHIDLAALNLFLSLCLFVCVCSSLTSRWEIQRPPIGKHENLVSKTMSLCLYLTTVAPPPLFFISLIKCLSPGGVAPISGFTDWKNVERFSVSHLSRHMKSFWTVEVDGLI